MASAVSTVIDTRLVNVLTRMALHILEDAAGRSANTPNGPTSGAAT
jgi:hypothetical protein